MEQSRRDDLESIGYIMIYLYKGNLPWHGIQERDQKERYRLIMETKVALPLEELCSDMPPCFAKYMAYIKNLDFEETPDYKLLEDLFKERLKTKLGGKVEPDWCRHKIEHREDPATPLSTSIMKFVKGIQAQVVANKKDGKIQYKKNVKTDAVVKKQSLLGSLLRPNLTVPQENANGDEISVGLSQNEEELQLEESSIPDENDKGKRMELPRIMVTKEFNKWGNITRELPPPLTAKPKSRYGFLRLNLGVTNNSQ
eukprot:TRINITY_DN8738_c0_g1_i2.p1 TRINITY_DN8738_c0_g1~~TRINITY_DN8738_c0_g1_i2.p1  ORF type:complete len:255 (-),score=53.43 TRINITY_DN8738_c0_g1_i2:76-840(-)